MRPMNIAEERIQWVIHFAEVDLDHIRTGEWIDLKEDMMDFLGWKPLGVKAEDISPMNPQGWAPWRETELTLQCLRFLRDVARKRLEAIAFSLRWFKRKKRLSWEEIKQEHEATARGVPDSLQVSAYIDVETGKPTGLNFSVSLEKGTVIFDLLKSGISRVRLVSENAEETFRVALGDTLSRADISYVRLCPTCARLFLAEHGRQQFCTTRCKSKAALQRFRKRHRKELNEKARANYKKKIRGQPGKQNVKVGTHQKRKTQPKEV